MTFSCIAHMLEGHWRWSYFKCSFPCFSRQMLQVFFVSW